jgi:hypothetical protein
MLHIHTEIKMKVSALTLMTLRLNALVDSGKYNDITIDEIHRAIQRKHVLQFLKQRIGNDIDLSIHLSSTWGDFEGFYETKLNDIYGGYAGDERRKWGIENLGLCLLVAWTNEIIQQGEGIEW